MSDVDFIGVKEPTSSEEENTSVQSVVVRFENEPWEDGVGAETSTVVARVIYRQPDGKLERVGYGVWMDAELRHTYFKVADTRELLLFLVVPDEKGQSVIGILEDKRTPNSHFDPAGWYRYVTLWGIASAEVTLTDQGNHARYVFDLEISKDNQDGFHVHVIKATLPERRQEA